jgi:enamine deaminase RidA (YjgF/YER057c/UK114 family)
MVQLWVASSSGSTSSRKRPAAVARSTVRTRHGQVARDAEGRRVGEGDLAAQVEQAYLNIGTALAEAGGSFDDVAKLTVYVVDWTPDKMPLLGEGVTRAAAKLGVDPVKPITLLGVAALGEPDLLVEVEATAVLD